MSRPVFNVHPRQLWLHVLSLLAGAAGAKLGYDFGAQIGGGLIAWVAALSCALFATLLAASLLDMVAGWFRPRPPQE
jgi:hypothetical protein